MKEQTEGPTADTVAAVYDAIEGISDGAGLDLDITLGGILDVVGDGTHKAYFAGLVIPYDEGDGIDSNTVIFAIEEDGYTAPVFCNKDDMTFNITTLSGSGCIVTQHAGGGDISTIPLEPGVETVALGKDVVHAYFGRPEALGGDKGPLVFVDQAFPRFSAGDETMVEEAGLIEAFAAAAMAYFLGNDNQ